MVSLINLPWRSYVAFTHFQSLVTSGKRSFSLKAGSALNVPESRKTPYIEPALEKEQFDHGEKPSVVLVSAVGATGKSALAQVLASTGTLPLLDLSKHKAVGDSTISGLLTNSFPASELSGVFGGLKDGSYGLIIDGLDEGRSKTTEQGFSAFLDDIISLAKDAPKPTFVLLGRTDIIETTWLYLSDHGVASGLVSISPFDRQQAHDYIDKMTESQGTPHGQPYEGARDSILNCLSGAFADSSNQASKGSFLSFIGYPPVLDAVATVLNEERNFHRIQTELMATGNMDREIELLAIICAFILKREQEEKVWPNILEELCSKIAGHDGQRIRRDGFSFQQQCVRLLAHCLQQAFEFSTFHDAVLDMRFEEQLRSFLPEHPFLYGRKFRNAVFEAYAVATALFSELIEHQQLAMDYVEHFRTTYHLVYMASYLGEGKLFPLKQVRALTGAALDFRSRNSTVEVEVDGTCSEVKLGQTLPGVHISLNVTSAKY